MKIKIKCATCDKIRFIEKSYINAGRFKSGRCFKCSRNKFGEQSSNWKGGKIMNDNGYVLIRSPKHPFVNAFGYVREHRLIMEKNLGRYLLPTEVVHHLNGDRTDNRIENLELLESQSIHVRERDAHRVKGICSICGLPQLARNFCKSHYWTEYLKAHRFSKKLS